MDGTTKKVLDRDSGDVPTSLFPSLEAVRKTSGRRRVERSKSWADRVESGKRGTSLGKIGLPGGEDEKQLFHDVDSYAKGGFMSLSESFQARRLLSSVSSRKSAMQSYVALLGLLERARGRHRRMLETEAASSGERELRKGDVLLDSTRGLEERLSRRRMRERHSVRDVGVAKEESLVTERDRHGGVRLAGGRRGAMVHKLFDQFTVLSTVKDDLRLVQALEKGPPYRDPVWVENRFSPLPDSHLRRLKAELRESSLALLEMENAGGSSENSEALSMEVLSSVAGAGLLLTEMEVEYDSSGSIVDYVAVTPSGTLVDESRRQKIGVSVTRAMIPWVHGGPAKFNASKAVPLLVKKLYGLLDAKACVAKHHRWNRAVLHIWAQSDSVAQWLRLTLAHLPRRLWEETVVMCTVAHPPDVLEHVIYGNVLDWEDRSGLARAKQAYEERIAREERDSAAAAEAERRRQRKAKRAHPLYRARRDYEKSLPPPLSPPNTILPPSASHDHDDLPNITPLLRASSAPTPSNVRPPPQPSITEGGAVRTHVLAPLPSLQIAASSDDRSSMPGLARAAALFHSLTHDSDADSMASTSTVSERAHFPTRLDGDISPPTSPVSPPITPAPLDTTVYQPWGHLPEPLAALAPESKRPKQWVRRAIESDIFTMQDLAVALYATELDAERTGLLHN